MEEIYNRTVIVLGKENVDKIRTSRVCICGIGGVGSYVLEALARTGIGNILIIDKDDVDITNINRQIIATLSTIGESKVDVACERVKDINSDIKVITKKENITSTNLEQLISDFSPDYIVDCVDNIEAKVAIIKYADEKNIKCISSMGMANKINPLDIHVSDIYKTYMCPLSKIMRKKLKECGVKKQKVVFSKEEAVKTNTNILGSVSFVPSVAGLVIASEVVKDLIA